MDLRDEFKAAVDIAAPTVGLSITAGRLVFGAIGLLIAGALAYYLFWKVFLAGPEAQAAHDIAQALAGAVAGQAMGGAGAAASNIVASGATKETIIHDTTRTNTIEITKQPGAGDPVSDQVDAAGRAAICMRASAAGLPDCQRLQEVRAEGLAGGSP